MTQLVSKCKLMEGLNEDLYPSVDLLFLPSNLAVCSELIKLYCDAHTGKHCFSVVA